MGKVKNNLNKGNIFQFNYPHSKKKNSKLQGELPGLQYTFLERR